MSVSIKKTDKIVTAIYMVTDYVSDQEPLKFRLRTLSLSLVSLSRKIGVHSAEPQFALVEEVIHTTEEMSSLLGVASTVGIISEMNGKILKTELEKVKIEIEHAYEPHKIERKTHPGYANILLSDDMFKVEESRNIFLSEQDKGHDNSKGHRQESSVLYKNDDKGISSFSMNLVKRRTTDIGIKIARRNNILEVVKGKGSVSIKDIFVVLKDVSEKTIQRELLALVKEGVLKKEGEKRWSTYRIAVKI